jgi:hypothetical protein
MPEEFKLNDHPKDEETKSEIDSPPCPKRPRKSLPRNQSQEEYRQLACEAKQIFLAIGFDRAQADSRVDMDQPENRNREHSKCALGERSRCFLKTQQQRREDHKGDAEKKDGNQQAPS